MTRASLSPLGATRMRYLELAGRAHEVPFATSLLGAAKDEDLSEEILELAWEASKWVQNVSSEERRAVVLLVLLVLMSARRGSTFLPITGPRAEGLISPLLVGLGLHLEEIARVFALARRIEESSALDGLIGPPKTRLPIICVKAGSETRLYPERLFDAERRVESRIFARKAESSDISAIQAALRDLAARPPVFRAGPMTLTPSQESAVTLGVSECLSVITGGPGTGKTSIVLSILRVLVRLGVDPGAIAVAAPTGKAANRLKESIDRGLGAVSSPSEEDEKLRRELPGAKTLHRLLGYRSRDGGFVHHEKHPLKDEVVIVDEASMADLLLVDRLLAVLKPRARLLFIGDADQLPSVEAGAVLRDVVLAHEASGRPAVFRLSESHRMRADDEDGRAILEAALLTHRGDGAGLLAGSRVKRRTSAQALEFRGVELMRLDSAEERRTLLSRWYKERVRGLPEFERRTQTVYTLEKDGSLSPEDAAEVRAVVAHFESFMILTVTRGAARPTGAMAVNQVLHEARAGGAVDLSSFLPGEPVLMERNDYERDLSNGDFGVVLSARERGGFERRVVAFASGNGVSVHPLESLRADLTLAYAMTVHKAQGSEFDRVVLVLPEVDLPLLSREIIYTAMTRAKKSVVIGGKGELLELAVTRRLERCSHLGAPESPPM